MNDSKSSDAAKPSEFDQLLSSGGQIPATQFNEMSGDVLQSLQVPHGCGDIEQRLADGCRFVTQ
jgi:hypothetical protein